MNKDNAVQKIWNYMLMHQPLQKSDVIFVLGSRDTRVAEYAAQLYLEEWAPIICKMVDRLHNLRSLSDSQNEKIERQIKETREKYLPIFELVNGENEKYRDILLLKINNQLNILERNRKGEKN